MTREEIIQDYKDTLEERRDIHLTAYQLDHLIDWVEVIAIQVQAPVILQGELLPCPFCGGEASIGTTRIGCKRTAELNNRTNGFFVNCIICGSNNNFLHLGYATEEIAKEHWNKRAGREPQSK